jgi:hypothetical protein
VPDEAVHQAIEIGPQSRRELALTITKARCTVIGDQPGPIIPVIPIAPARPLLPALLPQYPITTHIYDNNSVYCLEYLKYLDKAKSKERLYLQAQTSRTILAAQERERGKELQKNKPQTSKYCVK